MKQFSKDLLRSYRVSAYGFCAVTGYTSDNGHQFHTIQVLTKPWYQYKNRTRRSILNRGLKHALLLGWLDIESRYYNPEEL